MKPFETPQKSVKKKLIFFTRPGLGREGLKANKKPKIGIG